MKLILLFIFFGSYQCSKNETDLDIKWTAFKSNFNKIYQSKEESDRKIIFEGNLKIIDEHNKKYEAGSITYHMNITEFADLKPSEYKEKFSQYVNVSDGSSVNFLSSPTTPSDLPKSVSWIERGFKTPVLHYGNCTASGYVFATIGSIEGCFYAVQKKLYEFSKQQIIDCSSGAQYPNKGCNGGHSVYSFLYIEDNGINFDKDYPYKGAKGVCDMKQESLYISTYGLVESGNEAMLMETLNKIGPISVSIDTNSASFSFYTGGIYQDDKCSNSMDSLSHSALLVGYGTNDKGIGYWTLKNSWGTRWGEDGYFYLLRNGKNMCGIATAAVYPIFAE